MTHHARTWLVRTPNESGFPSRRFQYYVSAQAYAARMVRDGHAPCAWVRHGQTWHVARDHGVVRYQNGTLTTIPAR
jgi:hypothetical protein